MGVGGLELDEGDRLAQLPSHCRNGFLRQAPLQDQELLRVLSLTQGPDCADALQGVDRTEINQIKHRSHRAAQRRIMFDRSEIGSNETQATAGSVGEGAPVDDANCILGACGILCTSEHHGHGGAARSIVEEKRVLAPGIEQRRNRFIATAGQRE